MIAAQKKKRKQVKGKEKVMFRKDFVCQIIESVMPRVPITERERERERERIPPGRPTQWKRHDLSPTQVSLTILSPTGKGDFYIITIFFFFRHSVYSLSFNTNPRGEGLTWSYGGQEVTVESWRLFKVTLRGQKAMKELKGL